MDIPQLPPQLLTPNPNVPLSETLTLIVPVPPAKFPLSKKSFTVTDILLLFVVKGMCAKVDIF
jgi:hypothetical protein